MTPEKESDDMSERSSQLGSANADGLDVHLVEFLATLAKAGYTKRTQDEKRRAISLFIRWVRNTRSSIADLDEVRIGAFLAGRSFRRRFKFKRQTTARAAVHQFLEHLRIVGVVPPRRSEPLPSEVLVRKYFDHLRDNRGLCRRSIEVYAPFVRAFVAAQRLPESVVALDVSAVRRYLLDRSRNRSVSFVKLLTAALRSFLSFCFLDGATAMDLSRAVPPVRRWRLAPVPPFLTAEEVGRVIAATDRSTPRGRRAYAMLLLLARLGLRAGEVATLELDDIRWDVGEIVVRGKGRLHDRLPLLDDVGEALALYLREARGPSTSRRVFVRTLAPHVGLSGPTAVCLVARNALRRAGLQRVGRVGAHIFRHGLATQMIRRGASLAEIAHVLRHRSITTTQLYAKVEFEGLRGVALPWPTTEGK
jgi:site-specific recombinase XerD